MTPVLRSDQPLPETPETALPETRTVHCSKAMLESSLSAKSSRPQNPEALPQPVVPASCSARRAPALSRPPMTLQSTVDRSLSADPVDSTDEKLERLEPIPQPTSRETEAFPP